MAPASRPRRIVVGRFLGQRLLAVSASRPGGPERLSSASRMKAKSVARRGRSSRTWTATSRSGCAAAGCCACRRACWQNDIALDGLTTDGVRALSAAADGSVWVATEHNLHHFSGNSRKVYSLSQTLALHTDQSGAVWAATTQDVVRVVGDRVQPVGLPSGLRPDSIASITTDAAGGLWLCHVNQQGVMRWAGGPPQPVRGRAGRVRQTVRVHLHGSTRTRVGRLHRPAASPCIEDGHFRVHDEKNGLVPGRVIAICRGSERVCLGELAGRPEPLPERALHDADDGKRTVRGRSADARRRQRRLHLGGRERRVGR